MGWQGEIFEDVANVVITLGASDEMKRVILGKLIDKLRDGDWDTEEESLEEFRGDPVIVELFAKRGVTMQCGLKENATDAVGKCRRKLGHNGDHVDEFDYSWPQKIEVIPA